MIEVKKINRLTAINYLKEFREMDEVRVQKELNRLEMELVHSVVLKGEDGKVAKGMIFNKFKIGADMWLGAFDGNRMVGIQWHCVNWHENQYDNKELKDVFVGNLYADNEEVAKALDEKFKELLAGRFVVNYSFCFPEDDFGLDFRKSQGYTIWGSAKLQKTIFNEAGTLYYLKRLSNFSGGLTDEQQKEAKRAMLKKQLEELDA